MISKHFQGIRLCIGQQAAPLCAVSRCGKYSHPRNGCDFVRLDSHNLGEIAAASGTFESMGCQKQGENGCFVFT